MTSSLSKPYFNSIPVKLFANPINAEIIYQYIIAEQTELNIKYSTIVSKIKVLVWLSNFHVNKWFNDIASR